MVVLAYHEIGRSGLDFLLPAGAEIRAVFTHEDDPGENVWFRFLARLSRDQGVKVHTPARINGPLWVEVIRAWKLFPPRSS